MTASIDKHFIAVIAIAIVIYFSNLGGTSIYILDEAKNAGCAMEMLQRGDAVVPTFNGKLRTDKPPLHYYFMMASYKVFGVTPFAARFFSALCGVLLVMLVYTHVKRLLSREAAFYASLVMLSSVQLAVQFHLAVPDPYLILLMTASLLFFYRGFHFHPPALTWFYVAMSLGFLTKGIIAVLLPGLIVMSYVIMIRAFNWSIITRMKVVMGIVIFCTVALPWYVAVGMATDGEWLRGFFIKHNMERYTSTMEGHRGFPLAPFVILIVALLPFSVFILQAVKMAWRERNNNTLLLFCLIVCAIIPGFFSFSKTILPSYPAPAIPFFAILLGYYLSQAAIGNYLKSIRIGMIINLGIGLLLLGAAYFVLKADVQLADLRYIAAIFIALPAGSILAWFCFRNQNITGVIYALSASWIMVTLLFYYWAYPQLDSRSPVTRSMSVVSQLGPDRFVLGYRIFNPAFVFTLKHVVDVADTPEQLQEMLQNHPQAVVLTRSKYTNEILPTTNLRVVYVGKDLFERTETVVLAN